MIGAINMYLQAYHMYLKANMEVEAVVELAHDLDASGMHSVRLHRVGFLDFC